MTQDGGRAAEVRLDNVAVGADALVGTQDGRPAAIERALDYGIAALCAEAVGIMTALERSDARIPQDAQAVRPADRPLPGAAAPHGGHGHRHRAGPLDGDDGRGEGRRTDAAERRRAISAAKAYIGQQARFVGQQAVQLHGGMGVVDELNVSHYFKRLTMIELTFGDVDHHLGLFSDTLRHGGETVARNNQPPRTSAFQLFEVLDADLEP
jgi:alkylation response protein AidB-like acyl-CoA dehydrogenase